MLILQYSFLVITLHVEEISLMRVTKDQIPSDCMLFPGALVSNEQVPILKR